MAEHKKCVFCGNTCTKLCDLPLSSFERRTAAGKETVLQTCDAPMCDECATQWRGMDICPACVNAILKEGTAFAERMSDLHERFDTIREVSSNGRE